MGNFSQFVRPGAKRLDVKHDFGKDILISAFRNPNGQKAVIVINQGTQEKHLDVKTENAAIITVWETSGSQSLQNTGEYSPEDSLVVKARSITTLVIESGNNRESL